MMVETKEKVSLEFMIAVSEFLKEKSKEIKNLFEEKMALESEIEVINSKLFSIAEEIYQLK